MGLPPAARLAALVAVLASLGTATTRGDDPDAPEITGEIEDPDGTALGPFFAALDRVAADVPGAVARVVHFGDSHTASPPFTEAIRAVLRDRFGEAGPGFVQPGRPWRSYDPAQLEVGASGVWTYDRVRGPGADNLADGRYGLGGFSARTSEADAAVWVQTERGGDAAGFEVEYLAQPEGGSADLLLDGEVVARIETAAAAPATARHRVRTERGAHRFEVRAAGDGEVRLLGLELDRPGPGVLYDVLGVNGARAEWLLSWDSGVLGEALANRAPDLVVLLFGTNEVGDSTFDLERAAEVYARALRRLREAVPEAACLVLAPPDMSARRRRGFAGTPEALGPLVEAQRAAARAAGCAFFDTFAAMGGAGTMDRWASAARPLAARDRVHLTARGYRALGASIAQALLRAYDGRGAAD